MPRTSHPNAHNNRNGTDEYSRDFLWHCTDLTPHAKLAETAKFILVESEKLILLLRWESLGPPMCVPVGLSAFLGNAQTPINNSAKLRRESHAAARVDRLGMTSTATINRAIESPRFPSNPPISADESIKAHVALPPEPRLKLQQALHGEFPCGSLPLLNRQQPPCP